MYVLVFFLGAYPDRLIDLVCSVDSVVTAVGPADHLAVMIIAIVIAIGVMMLSAKAVGQCVDQHPIIKMLP